MTERNLAIKMTRLEFARIVRVKVAGKDFLDKCIEPLIVSLKKSTCYTYINCKNFYQFSIIQTSSLVLSRPREQLILQICTQLLLLSY